MTDAPKDPQQQSPPPTAADDAPPAGQEGGVFRRRVARVVNSRRSRMVQTMKVALPLAALGILALLAAWPNLIAPQARKLSGTPSDSELLQPRYFAVDEKGQPFSLVAKSARENNAAANMVDLTEPVAEMTEQSGAWVTIRGDLGYYNRQTKLLHLVGGVRILKDDGAEYHTEEAFADTPTGNAWGDRRIIGQGPQGEVAAEGFRMTDRGRTMVFINQSAAAVSAAAGQGAPPAAPPPPALVVPAGKPAAVPSPVAGKPAQAVAPAAAVPAPPAAPAAPSPAPAVAKPAPAAAPPVWTPPPPARKPKPPAGKPPASGKPTNR